MLVYSPVCVMIKSCRVHVEEGSQCMRELSNAGVEIKEKKQSARKVDGKRCNPESRDEKNTAPSTRSFLNACSACHVTNVACRVPNDRRRKIR